MPGLKKTIEIAAPPEVVRAKFLDWQQIPNYHPDGFFKTIKPADPSKPLEVGDKLILELQPMSFTPKLIENSPNRFRWLGSLPGVFTGEHNFSYEPSKTTPGGTTFSQWEEFSGILSFLMGEGALAKWYGMREQSATGWEKFNQDLKKFCEESK
ncbi:hypothetical protein BU24DRAFT_363586 [Aaosphaeria arxii CBS 175.79]|uniref:SRPBCC domain-containing protein n=1 Tax=Aaosphaeria arxii CBS 175.79 TaxID=1450172 RepID=A0A6A5YCC8_9PLEO|nr:uncharacterized protein BU24DRAFT_363586 [Aaosphaeria arxii CBS 175.79]KAF2022350.1 hypothetical protein BU24DRAFT_363586 [Aaosphaeria arxii CBS 175.79]